MASYDEQSHGAVTVLRVSGPLTGNAAGTVLPGRLDALLDAGAFLFVFDLAGVNDADSSALGMLVTLRERVRKRDGVIRLVLSSRGRELFAATRLDHLFEIFDDRQEALESFLPQSETAGIP